MKNPLITVAFNALRWYIGTGVFDRVSELVRNLIFAAITGPEKRQQVIDFARSEFLMIRTRTVEAIIAVTLLRFSDE